MTMGMNHELEGNFDVRTRDHDFYDYMEVHKKARKVKKSKKIFLSTNPYVS